MVGPTPTGARNNRQQIPLSTARSRPQHYDSLDAGEVVHRWPPTPTGPILGGVLTGIRRMRGALASAAEEFISQAPEAFPLRDPFGITVVFGKTKPAFEGYGSISPIVEVLADVGMIEDERLEIGSATCRIPTRG